MKKISVLLILIFSTFLFSCQEESLIKPGATDNFAGTYDLQKIELTVDNNTLVLPFKFTDTKFVFKADGTFEYPEELYFYEGKYKYSATDKTITFSDDDPEYAYKSVLNVEKSSDGYILKTKTEDIPSDFLSEDVTYEQEIALFTLFMLEDYQNDSSVQKFIAKLSDDPKKFSMNYYLKKK